MKNLVKIVLLVISVSCMAQAYIVPGPSKGGNGGSRPAPYPGDGHNGGHHGGGHNGGHHGGGHTHPYPSNPYPGNPYPSDPYPSDPYPGNPTYGQEIKRIYLNRRVMNERLPLRQLANIGRQYSGWEVLSVRARTRYLNSGRPSANLISDGRIVATQYDASYQIYLVPQYRLVLGELAHSLQLEINGDVHIEDIEIELRGNGNNPYPGQNIEINIYRSVYGNDHVDLSQYIDSYRNRGYTIDQVIITASARYNTGFISLSLNGTNVGQAQFSGGYSQRATYRPYYNNVIGQGAEHMTLHTQGDMTIEHVTIVLR